MGAGFGTVRHAVGRAVVTAPGTGGTSFEVQRPDPVTGRMQLSVFVGDECVGSVSVPPGSAVELAAWLCELSGTGAAVLGRRGP
jgi:hypothetical protein